MDKILDICIDPPSPLPIGNGGLLDNPPTNYVDFCETPPFSKSLTEYKNKNINIKEKSLIYFVHMVYGWAASTYTIIVIESHFLLLKAIFYSFNTVHY